VPRCDGYRDSLGRNARVTARGVRDSPAGHPGAATTSRTAHLRSATTSGSTGSVIYILRSVGARSSRNSAEEGLSVSPYSVMTAYSQVPQWISSCQAQLVKVCSQVWTTKH
jgi:hypothetical protein